MKQYRCGLIARDIHNSITPSVYEVYARDIGMEIDFSLFNIEPEQLKGQVDFCRAHLDGFNVTMPYKQKLLEFVDEADDSALKCGSTFFGSCMSKCFFNVICCQKLLYRFIYVQPPGIMAGICFTSHSMNLTFNKKFVIV